MNFKSLFEKIPDILLAQLITFSMVFALTSSLHLTYPIFKIVLLVIICISALCFMFHNKVTSAVSFALSGTLVVVTLIYVLWGIGINKFFHFLDDYFFWLSEFMRYTDIPDPLFQFITVLSLCILISIFLYCTLIRKFRFLIVIIAGMSLFGIQWTNKLTNGLEPFYLFLAAALIIYLKHIYKLKSAKGINDYAKPIVISVWSVPICILIIVLASTFQTSEKPIEWKWLDKKIVSVYNYLKKNLDYETFDYFSLSASSGFGDRNNILGGRVRLDRTNVLRVSTSKRIYLKGISKDIYTGSNWANSVPELTQTGTDYTGMFSDFNEMMQGMEILTGKENFTSNYFDKNPVSVTFLNIKTKSLFLPSKVNSFKPTLDDFSGYVNNTGDYSTRERLTKGFKYTVDVLSPKIGNKEFEDVLRKSKKGLYNEYLLKLEFPSYFKTSATPLVLDSTSSKKLELFEELTKLKEKSELIYKNYLQLPDNLPQRVKDLSASLVATSNNNFDKAKAIEQYLASNFPYNLDVHSTPRNRDFVDYFLFDLKEGYCSYYASAMTILARIAGLPARYVEGYMLPPDPLKESSTTFIITNMQAHAWVEIYFEGYGWLPFEPTSPFRSNFYSTTIPEVDYGDGYNPAYFDYMEMMRRYSDRNIGDITLGVNNDQSKLSIPIIVMLVFGTILLLFVSFLLFNIIKNRYKLYKLCNMPTNECILSFYEYYVNVLGLHGMGLLPAETPSQYSTRIDSFMFFSPVRFKVITDIFIKSRYSLNEATELEKQLFCDFHPGFLSEIKINMGKFRYFVLKYLLGKF